MTTLTSSPDKQAELAEIYSVFDVDGDGKVKASDIDAAITHQAYDAAEKILSPTNPQAIVDIQVCSNNNSLLGRNMMMLHS